MYSYEFVNKGDLTGFRCLDQEFIWIDKEDMAHVLSAEGYWFNESNKTILKNKKTNEEILLGNYLLNSFNCEIRHINNNHLDFRKKNLLISMHNHTPYFIRPLSIFDFPNLKTESHLKMNQRFFAIKKSHKNIGYICFLPVSKKIFQNYINNNLSKQELLEHSSLYENESTYYHMSYGDFPNDDKLLNYIHSYYGKLIHHLSLRSINISEVSMNSANSSFFLGEKLKKFSHQWNSIGHKDITNLQIKLNSSIFE